MADNTDKSDTKRILIDLLPKYKYDLKYMIEHDIDINERDLDYLKSRINKYWTMNEYNIFTRELRKYYS